MDVTTTLTLTTTTTSTITTTTTDTIATAVLSMKREAVTMYRQDPCILKLATSTWHATQPSFKVLVVPYQTSRWGNKFHPLHHSHHHPHCCCCLCFCYPNSYNLQAFSSSCNRLQTRRRRLFWCWSSIHTVQYGSCDMATSAVNGLEGCRSCWWRCYVRELRRECRCTITITPLKAVRKKTSNLKKELTNMKPSNNQVRDSIQRADFLCFLIIRNQAKKGQNQQQQKTSGPNHQTYHSTEQ
jgi:hypothetical protein